MDPVSMLEDAAFVNDLARVKELLPTVASFGEALDRASEGRNWVCAHLLLQEMDRRRGRVDCNDVTGPITVVYNIKPFCPLGMNGRLSIPLKLATRANEHTVVRALLRAGAGDKVGSALHVAIRNDSYESAELIMRDTAGASSVNEVDSSGKPPLEVCTAEGSPRMATLLLEVGKVNINAVHGSMGYTALHRAVTLGSWEVMLVLLSRPDIELNMTCGVFKDTALHAASYSGVCTRALLKRGANPNARSRDGSTPLHDAVTVRTHSLLAAKELVRAGADTNATCSRGRSPLHAAAGVANPEAVKLLLWPGGADENAEDRDGKTAAQLVGKLVSPSKVDQEDVEKVNRLLDQAPRDREWRRRSIFVCCRAFWVTIEQTSPGVYRRRRLEPGLVEGGAGSGSSVSGAIIWVVGESCPPEIFRCIMSYV